MHVDLPQQENAVAIDPIVLKRVDRFIDHLSCNANGDYEIDDVVRVLIGAGLERPVVERALRSHVEGEAIGHSAISRSELHGLMCAHLQADIGRMSYFDKMYEATPQERQAVGASRLMIESRIDYMTQSVKAGDTERRVSFDMLHLVTIVFFFTIDLLYNLTYFDREPMDVYWAIVAIHGVWLLDVAWNVALPAVDAQGVVVTNPWDVILCKWRILAIDVVALLPIDLVLYWFCSEKAPETFLPNDGNHPHLVAFLVWRLIKLIKVVRLKSLFAFVTLDVVTPRFVTIFFLLKPLVHIAAATVMTIHIVTCICLHVLKEDFSLPPQFDYLNQLVDVVSMLTASGPNVGYSGPASQPVLLTLMACGLIAQAAVISNLSVTVFRNDVAAMNIQQMRETLSILEHFRVPKDVSTEILSYQLHALNDDVSQRLSTLRTLPVAMQQEVLLYVKVAAVNTVKLFTKASHDCKMKIAELLVQTVVPPTTDIVAIGDVGEEMFLIAHGYASVIIFNGMTVAMLSRGDYFGEVALLLPNNIRQATVRALTYCDLWVLDKHSFLEILTKFPGLMLAMEDDLKAKGVDTAQLRSSRVSTHVTQQDDPLSIASHRRVHPQTSASASHARICDGGIHAGNEGGPDAHMSVLERSLQFMNAVSSQSAHHPVVRNSSSSEWCGALPSAPHLHGGDAPVFASIFPSLSSSVKFVSVLDPSSSSGIRPEREESPPSPTTRNATGRDARGNNTSPTDDVAALRARIATLEGHIELMSQRVQEFVDNI